MTDSVDSAQVRAVAPQPSLAIDRARQVGGAVHAVGTDLGAGYTAEVARLFDEYYEFLWRALYRLGVASSQVDDAIQDLFIVVFRRYGEFHGNCKIRTWLYGIALRVAIAYRRNAGKRRFEPLDDEDVRFVCEGTPEEQRERLEAAEEVQRILETMDEPLRIVFTMTELEQFSAPEIATVLGIPVNTVYSRLRLARAFFERAAGRIQQRQRREP